MIEQVEQLLQESNARDIQFSLDILNNKISAIGNRWQEEQVNVFLHGWLDNCYSFLPLLPYFSSPYLAIDLPGHGLSPLSTTGIPHFSDYPYYVHHLIAQLPAHSVNLIGHSMGGAIASLYAGIFPEKINKLVLIEAIGPLSGEEALAPQNMKTAIDSFTKSALRKNPSYESMDKAAEIRSKTGLPLEAAKILVERGVDQSKTGVTWRHDPRLKLSSPKSYSEPQVLAYLEQITAATLLIKGQSSFLSDNAMVHKRIASIKNFTSTTIRGGHHVHMENPRDVAQMISHFID